MWSATEATLEEAPPEVPGDGMWAEIAAALAKRSRSAQVRSQGQGRHLGHRPSMRLGCITFRGSCLGTDALGENKRGTRVRVLLCLA